jgi:hypothetical protein
MDYCIDLFDPTALGEVTKKQGGYHFIEMYLYFRVW